MENISRTKVRADVRITGGASRPRHPAGGIVGPVAVEPDHAKFDARPNTCKAAILDDGKVHRAHLAVADRRLRSAEAAGDISRFPRPECNLANVCESGNLKG